MEFSCSRSDTETLGFTVQDSPLKAKLPLYWPAVESALPILQGMALSYTPFSESGTTVLSSMPDPAIAPIRFVNAAPCSEECSSYEGADLTSDNSSKGCVSTPRAACCGNASCLFQKQMLLVFPCKPASTCSLAGGSAALDQHESCRSDLSHSYNVSVSVLSLLKNDSTTTPRGTSRSDGDPLPPRDAPASQPQSPCYYCVYNGADRVWRCGPPPARESSLWAPLPHEDGGDLDAAPADDDAPSTWRTESHVDFSASEDDASDQSCTAPWEEHGHTALSVPTWSDTSDSYFSAPPHHWEAAPPPFASSLPARIVPLPSRRDERPSSATPWDLLSDAPPTATATTDGPDYFLSRALLRAHVRRQESLSHELVQRLPASYHS